MTQRKMYMDIDGVLIVWNEKYQCIELSRGYGQLMRFCKIHDIQPYWLSQWCHNPETLIGLNCLLWPRTAGTMAEPQIQSWKNSKASAIDYDSDFVWIEDGIDDDEMDILRSHNATDRFFWCHGTNPDALLHFMEFTRKRLSLPKIDNWESDWDNPFVAPLPEKFEDEVGGYCR